MVTQKWNDMGLFFWPVYFSFIIENTFMQDDLVLAELSILACSIAIFYHQSGSGWWFSSVHFANLHDEKEVDMKKNAFCIPNMIFPIKNGLASSEFGWKNILVVFYFLNELHRNKIALNLICDMFFSSHIPLIPLQLSELCLVSFSFFLLLLPQSI